MARMTDDGLLLVRNSERSAYRRCRQRWWWGWVEGLKPNDTAVPLKFGDLIHQALAAYYIPGKKRGPHPTETFIALYEADLEKRYKWGMRDEEGEWHDAYDLGIEMLNHYIDVYGDDKHLEVVAPEMSFNVDLYDDDDNYVMTAVGTFDAVVKDLRTGKYGLLEHKTAKSIQTKHLQLDEQAGTYWALAGQWLRDEGVLGADDDIDFILYNFLRKAMRDERPVNDEGLCLNKPTKAQLTNACKELGIDIPKKATVEDIRFAMEMEDVDPDKFGDVSKNQPPPYFERLPVYRGEVDRENILTRIKQVGWELYEVQQGRLPVYKNPTRDCGWDCAFYDVCELHETGSDWEELINLTMGTWDPYESHDDRDIDIPAGVT
jgi:hypothetical protein